MICFYVLNLFFAFSFPDYIFIFYYNTFVRIYFFSAVFQLRPCFLFGIGDVLCFDVPCRVGSGRVTPGLGALRRGASRLACPVLCGPVLSCPILSCPVRSERSEYNSTLAPSRLTIRLYIFGTV